MARTKTQSTQKSLKHYHAKRDLTKSPEPKGKVSRSSHSIFVIQKHAASHLHYDFRIAFEGVLKSWAIPKGPSLNPSDKRLAVQTEDHPIDYKDFEGVIPKGSYGAGTVMVWDRGTYKNIKEKNNTLIPLEECFKEGSIEIFVKGQKIQGAYALIRIKDTDNQWLFIKMRDEYASARKNPVNTQNKSVKTGRTMTQIRRQTHTRE